MTTRTSAKRYARALFDVAQQESSAEQVQNDLSAVSGLFEQNPELLTVLTNPAIPANRKRAIIDALLPKLGLSSPVGKLLQLLAERDRFGLWSDLVDVYRERIEQLHRVVRAEITTAEPLPAEKAATLQQRLSQITGRTVTMTTAVDPSMIGGLRARIGSTVYDGSLATQLESLRQKLAAM